MKILFNSVLLLAFAAFGVAAFHSGHFDPHVLMAVAFVPSWVAVDATSSGQSLMSPYVPGSNPALLTGVEPSFQFLQGSDPSLGIGQFVYGQCSNAGGIVAGAVCEVTQTLAASGASVSLNSSFQPWQGTANSGKTLAVSLVALSQFQYGWFQVFGAALMNTSAAVALNAAAYFNAATGVVQSAAVAGKQMLGAVCIVASSASFGQSVWTAAGTLTPALTATQGIYLINAPTAQGAIT